MASRTPRDTLRRPRRPTQAPAPAAAPSVETSSSSWGDRDLSSLATGLHIATLAGAFVLLLWLNRDHWFITDEWNALVDRRLIGDETHLGIWDPHNEHWATIPVLLYRLLFALFGVQTYWPYVVVLLLVHLTVVHLLWRIMKRIGVEPMLATVLCGVFAVLGAASDNLFLAFQITLVAPLAFGLGALLVTPVRGAWQRRDVVVWLLLVLGLMCSGTGVTVVVVVGLAVLLGRGWKLAASMVALPAVVYGAWYLTYGHEAADQSEPLQDALRATPAFVWNGLTRALDATTGLDGIAPALLVALAGWLVVRAHPRTEPWPIPVAMAAGAAAFLFLTAIRRSGEGIDAGGTSRYIYGTIALLLPVLAMAIGALLPRTSIRLLFVAGLAGFLLLVQIPLLSDEASRLASLEQPFKRRILATAELVRDGSPILQPIPVPVYIGTLTAEKIAALARRRRSPRERAPDNSRPSGRRDLRPAPRRPGTSGVDRIPTSGVEREGSHARPRGAGLRHRPARNGLADGDPEHQWPDRVRGDDGCDGSDRSSAARGARTRAATIPIVLGHAWRRTMGQPGARGATDRARAPRRRTIGAVRSLRPGCVACDQYERTRRAGAIDRRLRAPTHRTPSGRRGNRGRSGRPTVPRTSRRERAIRGPLGARRSTRRSFPRCPRKHFSNPTCSPISTSIGSTHSRPAASTSSLRAMCSSTSPTRSASWSRCTACCGRVVSRSSCSPIDVGRSTSLGLATPLEHLIEDHACGMTRVADYHVEEFVELVDKGASLAALPDGSEQRRVLRVAPAALDPRALLDRCRVPPRAALRDRRARLVVGDRGPARADERRDGVRVRVAPSPATRSLGAFRLPLGWRLALQLSAAPAAPTQARRLARQSDARCSATLEIDRRASRTTASRAFCTSACSVAVELAELGDLRVAARNLLPEPGDLGTEPFEISPAACSLRGHAPTVPR